ncbi:MAG: hypothetical protein Aurels2KO_29990 [Aureliella sp.]
MHEQDCTISVPQKPRRQFALAMCLLLVLVPAGCRRLAPIHVWQPSGYGIKPGSKLAIGPLTGHAGAAKKIEAELLAQRPAARADLAIFTAEQLNQRSPVQLASTAALSSDAIAIKAARRASADILLQGQILSTNLNEEADSQPKQIDYNQLYFAQPEEDKPDESLLVSWRLIDVATAQTIGTHVVNVQTTSAKQQYPDLVGLEAAGASPIFIAAARETWKSVAPVVSKDQVRLATSTLQPGSLSVRIGNRLARKGNWQAAEQHWRRAAQWFPLNAAAQHNLALALAAREDFPAAKEQLAEASGPFAFRLPSETLFWLDVSHRNYVMAHQLPAPEEGFSIERPQALPEVQAVTPIELDDLPWWTAIPGAKPPGWTWKDWLTQPIVL